MRYAALALILTLILGGCGSATRTAETPAPAAESTPVPMQTAPPVTTPAADLPDTFSGINALAYAEVQMGWIPRDTGTMGWQANGDWIVATLLAHGWEVDEYYFPVPENITGRNIVARRGSGPLVLVGAHYDSRRFADQDPDPARRNDPVPGANDGASGVGVLLELARVLTPERLDEEVWLVFFDAEDNGSIGEWGWTLGSADLARKLPRAPEAVVIVDMVGDADQQLYYEQTSTPELREAIWSIAAELGYDTFIPEEKYSILDDHTAFLQEGYAAIDIIDYDYPYWHTVEDTFDKLSAESLEAVGRTVEVWLTERR